MTSRISVVTSCTNGRDFLLEDQVQTGGKFIAYVDKISDSSIWEQRLAYNQFLSSRRNSRIHKILIHQYVDTEYSLWMDANMKLLVPAETLVEEWMGKHDIAIFKHRLRNCIYEEAKICADLKLDDPDVIREQINRYQAAQFPRDEGLAEACVILRRNSLSIENFNNAWWSEYSRHSVRDQISLMVAAKKSSVLLNLITPTRFDHPYFYSEPRHPGMESAVNFPPNVLDIC